MTLVRRETPEDGAVAKKVAELTALEETLGQRELELATLLGEIHSFESRYLGVVGRRFAELDEVNARIVEAQASSTPEAAAAREEATAARESARAAGKAPLIQFQPSEDLKKLFREVAKRIHPDLADDGEERQQRTRLMIEANRAFEEGDETRLRTILDVWESSPDSVRGDGPGAELIRVIRKIAQVQGRIDAIEAEMEDPKASDMYHLMKKEEEAADKGRNLLEEMASTLDQQISAAQDSLADLKAAM